MFCVVPFRTTTGFLLKCYGHVSVKNGKMSYIPCQLLLNHLFTFYRFIFILNPITYICNQFILFLRGKVTKQKMAHI